MVNFGKVRMAKSTLLTTTWCSWDLLTSFKVCLHAKESGVRKATGSYRTYSSLVKLHPWFLSLRWKTWFRQNCKLGSWVLEWKTCLCAELRKFAVEDLLSAELQPWFLSLRWKTCLRQNCNRGSCSCSDGLALGQNTLMIMMMIFCTKCWWRDMSIYLVFSEFTSKPMSLFSFMKISVFFLSSKYTNDIREEIKRRINVGNACYYSLEKILSSCLLSKKLKVNTYCIGLKLLYYRLYCMVVKLGPSPWERSID